MSKFIALLIVCCLIGSLLVGLVLSQNYDLPDGMPTPTAYQTPTCQEYYTPFCPTPTPPIYDCSVVMPPPPCLYDTDEPTPEAITSTITAQQGQTSQDQYKRDYEAFLSRVRAISYALSSQYQVSPEMLGAVE